MSSTSFQLARTLAATAAGHNRLVTAFDAFFIGIERYFDFSLTLALVARTAAISCSRCSAVYVLRMPSCRSGYAAAPAGAWRIGYVGSAGVRPSSMVVVWL